MQMLVLCQDPMHSAGVSVMLATDSGFLRPMGFDYKIIPAVKQRPDDAYMLFVLETTQASPHEMRVLRAANPYGPHLKIDQHGTLVSAHEVQYQDGEYKLSVAEDDMPIASALQLVFDECPTSAARKYAVNFIPTASELQFANSIWNTTTNLSYYAHIYINNILQRRNFAMQPQQIAPMQLHSFAIHKAKPDNTVNIKPAIAASPLTVKQNTDEIIATLSINMQTELLAQPDPDFDLVIKLFKLINQSTTEHPRILSHTNFSSHIRAFFAQFKLSVTNCIKAIKFLKENSEINRTLPPLLLTILIAQLTNTSDINTAEITAQIAQDKLDDFLFENCQIDQIPALKSFFDKLINPAAAKIDTKAQPKNTSIASDTLKITDKAVRKRAARAKNAKAASEEDFDKILEEFNGSQHGCEASAEEAIITPADLVAREILNANFNKALSSLSQKSMILNSREYMVLLLLALSKRIKPSHGNLLKFLIDKSDETIADVVSDGTNILVYWLTAYSPEKKESMEIFKLLYFAFERRFSKTILEAGYEVTDVLDYLASNTYPPFLMALFDRLTGNLEIFNQYFDIMSLPHRIEHDSLLKEARSRLFIGYCIQKNTYGDNLMLHVEQNLTSKHIGDNSIRHKLWNIYKYILFDVFNNNESEDDAIGKLVKYGGALLNIFNYEPHVIREPLGHLLYELSTKPVKKSDSDLIKKLEIISRARIGLYEDTMTSNIIFNNVIIPYCHIVSTFLTDLYVAYVNSDQQTKNFQQFIDNWLQIIEPYTILPTLAGIFYTYMSSRKYKNEAEFDHACDILKLIIANRNKMQTTDTKSKPETFNTLLACCNMAYRLYDIESVDNKACMTFLIAEFHRTDFLHIQQPCNVMHFICRLFKSAKDIGVKEICFYKDLESIIEAKHPGAFNALLNSPDSQGTTPLQLLEAGQRKILADIKPSNRLRLVMG